MLTIFLMPTNDTVANSGRAVDSLKGLAYKVVLIKNIADINTYEKETPWYGILYDNEILDNALYLLLKDQLLNAVADVVVLYRMSLKQGVMSGITYSPRLFRKKVLLQGDSMFPEQPGLTVDKLGAGYVVGYDN